MWMDALRFIFGHGWWIAWYGAFWVVVLLLVVLWLYVFGREIPWGGGERPKATPGSMLVFAIGLGLTLVTSANVALWLMGSEMSGWARPMWVGLVAVVVGAATLSLNLVLLERAGVTEFVLNCVAAGVLVVANLVVMHQATHPARTLNISGWDGVWLVMSLVAIPLTSAGALFAFALYRELTKR